MNRMLKAALTATFLGACTAASASASTIILDFEDVAVDNNILNNIGQQYTSNGFTLRSLSTSALYVAGTASTLSYAGSTGLHVRSGNAQVDFQISTMDGSLFKFESIELSTLRNVGVSPAVTFTGFNANGSQVASQTFQPTTFGFQRFDFTSDFDGIARVAWRQGTGQNYAHQFDNITLNTAPVPIPAAAPLMLAGIALLSLRKRAKRA